MHGGHSHFSRCTNLGRVAHSKVCQSLAKVAKTLSFDAWSFVIKNGGYFSNFRQLRQVFLLQNMDKCGRNGLLLVVKQYLPEEKIPAKVSARHLRHMLKQRGPILSNEIYEAAEQKAKTDWKQCLSEKIKVGTVVRAIDIRKAPKYGQNDVLAFMSDQHVQHEVIVQKVHDNGDFLAESGRYVFCPSTGGWKGPLGVVIP